MSERAASSERTKNAFVAALRAAWRLLPLTAAQRVKLAEALFTISPGLFVWSPAYQHWRAERSARTKHWRGAHATDDPGLEGCVPLLAKAPPRSVPVRAIAFYLPQFHQIPENDAWWGKGFTEWTNVRAAQPRFAGHYQPHEPGELGYYDLLADEGVMRRQAELAKLHGIGGFCFYFYWFAGKRLLEAPTEKYFTDKGADLPFCLCWANENWTRRWDGKDREVLIAQQHSAEDDIAFIQHVSKYFADPRYIRIDGRALLLVYRPVLLPSAKATAERWRTWLRENGFGEVYLAYTQAFELTPPEAYGFDAAIEFPPNNFGVPPESDLARDAPAEVELLLYDWRKLSLRAQALKPPAYKLFRGVNCGWDNTARRTRGGAVFLNATPSGFRAWLNEAINDTLGRLNNPDERLVFINAWNEWAEGAHLEPDRKHGYAWLEAARRALDDEAQRKVIVVTHDMHRHGAQYIALNIVRTLKRSYAVDVACISAGPGDLAPEFEREGPLLRLDASMPPAVITAEISALVAKRFRHAIINSAASAWLAPYLSRHGVRIIGLVHEMPQVLAQKKLEAPLRELDATADALVFPAARVRDQNANALGRQWRNAHVLPQGLYKAGPHADATSKEAARRRLIAQLGLSGDTQFVLGVGFADMRKGVDIFITWATAAAKRWPLLHFVWLGNRASESRAAIDAALEAAGPQRANIHFPGFSEDTHDFYAAARLYALTSREDPFPSTAIEALAVCTPVIMVEGTGGIEELATEPCVRAIEDIEPETFLAAAAPWIENDSEVEAAGHAGRAMVRERLGFSTYSGALLDLLHVETPAVSVIVPSYNYAHHLEQRLESILQQTLAPREIIVLDDASTDDSIAVAERVLTRSTINWRIVRNGVNSGSVFKQWRKGAELARHELIWIAEADDWAERHFLEVASLSFRRADVVLSVTQSRQVDAAGRTIAPDYLDYVRDVSPEKWTRAFVGDGPEEVRAGLSIKNTIPNASAVVFRREAFLKTIITHEAEILSYRVAGDWCAYVNLLRNGALAFTPTPLNNHRRHDASVTISRFGLEELTELVRMQAYVDRTFAPGSEIRCRAYAYLEELVKRFDLERRFGSAKVQSVIAEGKLYRR